MCMSGAASGDHKDASERPGALLLTAARRAGCPMVQMVSEGGHSACDGGL